MRHVLLGQHFRSHVLGTAAVGGGELIGPESGLAESEVSYLEVSVQVDHDVFGFDISVYDVLAVQVLNAQQDLDEAVASLVLTHLAHLPQVVEQLSTRTIWIKEIVHSSARATKCLVSKANSRLTM